MFVNIIDVVILLFLLSGAVVGFKKGIIKSVVSFVGTILVLVLSFALKEPLSVLLYTYLPFFNFSLSAINILLYEAIAFFIVFALLSAILKIVIKISGVIELLLKFTVILAIPSKILGAIFGFLEHSVFAFVILFVLAQLNINNELITGSSLSSKILSNTPIMSSVAEDTYKTVEEFININKEDKTDEEKNTEAINTLLKYNIISEENLEKLVEKEKFSIPNLEDLLKKGEKND